MSWRVQNPPAETGTLSSGWLGPQGPRSQPACYRGKLVPGGSTLQLAGIQQAIYLPESHRHTEWIRAHTATEVTYSHGSHTGFIRYQQTWPGKVNKQRPWHIIWPRHHHHRLWCENQDNQEKPTQDLQMDQGGLGQHQGRHKCLRRQVPRRVQGKQHRRKPQAHRRPPQGHARQACSQ